MMETAKLFRNGRSQAVRLPKAYRFEGNEVYIKKNPDLIKIDRDKNRRRPTLPQMQYHRRYEA